MTTSKSILTLSSIAVAMMFGGGVYVMMHLNTLLKPQIERLASEALGVKVSVGKLEVTIQEMRATAQDIRIANPKGFSKPYAVTFKNADVKIAAMEKKLVTFESIAIDGVEANLEVKEASTNFHAIQKGMRTVKDPKDGEEPVKIILKKFTLSEAKVNPTVTLIANQDLEPVKMNPIILRNIGGSKGVLPGEAVKQITTPVMKEAGKAAGRAGYYQGLSEDALKEMGLNQIQGLSDKIQKEIDNVGDAIKGLFN